VEASRFATQVVGLGYSLLLFLGVLLLRRRWPFAGACFLLYALLYFAGQFFLEFARGDEAIYLGTLRLAQVLDLVLALAAGVALLLLWWRWRTGPQEPEDAPEEVGEDGEANETGDAPQEEGETAGAGDSQELPEAGGTDQDPAPAPPADAGPSPPRPSK
jgi:protein-S-isoprenylcysteine O-methyltransferase Ste14